MNKTLLKLNNMLEFVPQIIIFNRAIKVNTRYKKKLKEKNN